MSWPDYSSKSFVPCVSRRAFFISSSHALPLYFAILAYRVQDQDHAVYRTWPVLPPYSRSYKKEIGNGVDYWNVDTRGFV